MLHFLGYNSGFPFFPTSKDIKEDILLAADWPVMVTAFHCQVSISQKLHGERVSVKSYLYEIGL